ncbi:hypothetical protein ACQB60_27690 [Actinomycetota bacterium Odt1-20B]
MKKKLLYAGAALTVLAGGLAYACSSDAFERCVPEKSKQVNSTELEGSYRGTLKAAGTRITLKTSPGRFGGTMTVRNWPRHGFPNYSKGSTFDDSGTWHVDTTTDDYPMVQLYFDKPDEPLTPHDKVERLSIGVNAKRSILYDDPDPDVCPDFLLTRD